LAGERIRHAVPWMPDFECRRRVEDQGDHRNQDSMCYNVLL
jgi:hypothetical protein